MKEKEKVMETVAHAWVGQEDSDEYWAEGIKATVEVELTDADEVRLGVRFAEDSSDTVTLYFSRANAEKAARFLAAASVDDLKVRA